VNPGFELGLRGWSSTGDLAASYVESLNPYRGKRNLVLRSSAPFSVTTEQSLTPLTQGNHTLRAWVQSSPDIGESYLFLAAADGTSWSTQIPGGLSSALRVSIADIDVSGCPCTVGIHGEGPGGSWIRLDDVELFAGDAEIDPNYLVGGDITFRRQLASLGVQFFDGAGEPSEVLDLLAAGGFNFVRIRIYNDPGSPDHYPSNQFAAGYQNLDDALSNARDAHARGMKILLSFHYSDYWTNPGTQYKPYRWEGLSGDELRQAVREYTRDAMQALAAQDTPPEIVALGNETNTGMLWPDARIETGGGNFAEFASVFNAAASAVKEVIPSAKVAIHLSRPEAGLDSWLGWAEANALDYDVVALSLYPFWSNMKVADMKRSVSHVIEVTGRPVVAAEIGYPWSLARASGFPTLIASNDLDPQGGETFGVSPEGQERYIRSFLQQMHEVPGFIGALYWDPIWIDVPSLPSNVGDTALFDWEGHALPALSAFHEKTW
jgi:arabinogalactan endo-1,4-beta-galactosidase